MKSILLDGEVEALLSELISARSVNPPGNEMEAAKVLLQYFQKKGIKCRLEYVKKGRPNIIAEAKGKYDKKGVLLTSHLDVVSEGERGSWKSNPFQAVLRNGKLYGRGACDAKGSLAALAIASSILMKNKNSLSGDVIFAGVIGEEKGGLGSKALVKRGIDAKAVIIGEPTSLDICIAHKGRLGITVEVTGKAAHTSQPEEGLNAVIEMVQLITRIEELGDVVKRRSNPLVGRASLTITGISGGGKETLIPERCILQIDRRLIPGETNEKAKKEFQELLNKFSRETKSKIKATYQEGFQVYSGSTDQLPVKAAAKAVKMVKGKRAKVTGFPAGCDMYIFSASGGYQAIVFGPGKVTLAHRANEYVNLKEVKEAVQIYVKTVENLWHDL